MLSSASLSVGEFNELLANIDFCQEVVVILLILNAFLEFTYFQKCIETLRFVLEEIDISDELEKQMLVICSQVCVCLHFGSLFGDVLDVDYYLLLVLYHLFLVHLQLLLLALDHVHQAIYYLSCLCCVPED
jgi:hypothetical protein